jgi:hypothetical protein
MSVRQLHGMHSALPAECDSAALGLNPPMQLPCGVVLHSNCCELIRRCNGAPNNVAMPISPGQALSASPNCACLTRKQSYRVHFIMLHQPMCLSTSLPDKGLHPHLELPGKGA